MKQRLIRVGILISGITIFCWALFEIIDALSDGFSSGNALNSILRIAVSLLLVIIYMVIVKRVTRKDQKGE